jgi:leucyl-tRNA synthetase
VHQWLGRVFAAVDDAVASDAAEPESLVRQTHKTVKGVTDDMERFRFNTAISKLQVLTNEMRASLDAGSGARDAARALVVMLAPLAPFAAEELWREVVGEGSSVHVSSWPTYDPALAADDTVTMVVQVNGKVRDKIEVSAGISDADAEATALSSDRVARALDGREIAKTIVRAPKLVNLVVRD